MALVKFVSDKDCQVFIDMELAGKVTRQSMLKVSLEIGCYLIQIKDEDGNLIKEYNLEIKPSDNQLLQKMDGTNDLGDIFEKLKNDSTLVFHCDRASFCHNGLYGFVDKKLNVVIPPIYYSVNEFVDDKAFVVRDFPEGRKTTMIDSDGNMFFNRWFDYIGESDEIILLGIDNRIIVYSKTKLDMIAEYFNANYDKKHPIVPVFKKDDHDELYGFIDYKGEEVVPLLFDKVENFNNNGYAKVSFWGVQSKIEQESFKLIDDIGDKYDIKSFDDLVHVYNSSGFFNERLERTEKYENNINIFKTVQPLLKKGKWTLRIITEFDNDNTSIDKDIECDKVIFLGDNSYVYRVGNQCFAYYFDSEEEIVIDAEFIIPANRIVRGENPGYDVYYPDTFITRSYGKYGTIDKNGKEIFPLVYNSIIPIQPNYFIDIYTNLPVYAILQRGCQYSLANLSVGKIYLPFEYDKVTLYRNERDSRKTIFKLHRGNKYMLFCIENELLTTEFDDIIICGKNNIVRIGNDYGVVDDCGQEIIPIKFDEISVLCSGLWVFVIKIGGKCGCINEKAEIIVPIEYDKIETNSSYWAPWDESYIVSLYKGDNAISMDLNKSRFFHEI